MTVYWICHQWTNSVLDLPSVDQFSTRFAISGPIQYQICHQWTNSVLDVTV